MQRRHARQILYLFEATHRGPARQPDQMAPFELSHAQLEHYETRGYVLLEQWLSPRLVGALQAEVEAGLCGQFPSTDPHSQWMWSRASAVPESVAPTLARAQELPEFLAPARQLLGDGALGLG